MDSLELVVTGATVAVFSVFSVFPAEVPVTGIDETGWLADMINAMGWDQSKGPVQVLDDEMVPVPEAMPENGKWLKIAKEFKVRGTERKTGRFGTPGKSDFRGSVGEA